MSIDHRADLAHQLRLLTENGPGDDKADNDRLVRLGRGAAHPINRFQAKFILAMRAENISEDTILRVLTRVAVDETWGTYGGET
jgi:hypothetical protein